MILWRVYVKITMKTENVTAQNLMPNNKLLQLYIFFRQYKWLGYYEILIAELDNIFNIFIVYYLYTIFDTRVTEIF